MSTEAVHPWHRERGSELCSDRHCEARDAVRCAYVDSAGRRCGTAWCAEHRDSVDHVTYCRRHAGVMRALSPALVSDLPGLDNRAPSLVSWVARLIDHDVRTLVGGLLIPAARVGSARVLPERHDGARVWVRRWTVFGTPPFTIELAVSERSDTVVMLSAGSSLLFAAEPPWITARLGDARPSDAQTRADRALFCSDLLSALERHLSQRQARRAAGE